MRSSFELVGSTQEFLRYLRSLDVQLWAEGDRLRADAPRGVLTPALQAEIASRKPELLSFLSQARAAADVLPPIQPVSRQQPPPLSVSQERIWSLAGLFPESSLYNMYLAFRLEGMLDVDALERAVAEVLRRHEILRTVFQTIDGRPVQVICPYAGWSLPVTDLQAGGDLDLEVQRWIAGQVGRAFDLAAGPLLRADLLRLGRGSHVLVLVMHHILSDGWSWDIFLKEITALYTAYRAGLPSPLAELPVQYADFAVWQQELMDDPKLLSQVDYWKGQLSGPVAELALPYDHPPTQAYAGSREVQVLPPELADRLRELSQAAGSTLFITLLAAFKALLHRWTGQEELLVCSPVACRTRPETQELVGYFNNLLPLRSDLSADPTFLELVGQVQRVALEAYERQDFPFHRLMELPGLERLTLTRAVFALQAGAGGAFALPGLQVAPLEVYNGTANFDLFFVVEDRGGALHCVLEYKTGLFDASTIAGLLGDYQTILEEVCAHPQRRLSALPLQAAVDRPSPGSPRTASQSAARDFVAPRTAVEKQLARIWEEYLGVAPIGVRDSFFALGGGSLLALKTFSRIERELGANLPLAALLQNPTIEYLAELVGASSASVSWASLVPIQPFGSNPAFYGVHGLEGNILFWRSIVEHLGPRQPFYGLQAQGIDGIHPALNSIERMAAHYIQEIRTVQPHGPYYLGGYSLGGEIAFEMAQQFLAAGEQVALLVLFDTSNPVRPVRPSEILPPTQAGPVWDGGGGSRLAALRRKLDNHLQRLAGLGPKDKLLYLWRDARMRGRRLAVKAAAAYYRRRRQRLPDALLLQNLVESHVIAVMEYVPRVYPGRITLFRASQSLPDNPVDDPMDWGPLAAGGIDLHVFESTHLIVDERFAKEVAGVLKQCLARAREGLSPPESSSLREGA